MNKNYRKYVCKWEDADHLDNDYYVWMSKNGVVYCKERDKHYLFINNNLFLSENTDYSKKGFALDNWHDDMDRINRSHRSRCGNFAEAFRIRKENKDLLLARINELEQHIKRRNFSHACKIWKGREDMLVARVKELEQMLIPPIPKKDKYPSRSEILSNTEQEEAVKITKFEFFIGGFTSTDITLKLKEGVIVLINRGSGCSRDRIVHTPSKEEWNEFSNSLKNLKIWNWKKDYYNPEVQDGTQWELSIEEGSSKLDCYGSNQYPPEFKDFVNTVHKLINATVFDTDDDFEDIF